MATQTQTNKEVKIVIPFIYSMDSYKMLVDFKDMIDCTVEGVDIIEAYYSTLAEEVVIRGKVSGELHTTLTRMYAKNEVVFRVKGSDATNGRIEVINPVRWY